MDYRKYEDRGALADEFGPMDRRDLQRRFCDLVDENRQLREALGRAQGLNTVLELEIEALNDRRGLDRENVRYLWVHGGVSH